MLVLVETVVKFDGMGTDSNYAVMNKEVFEVHKVAETLKNANFDYGFEVKDVKVKEVNLAEVTEVFNTEEMFDFSATLDVLKANVASEVFEEVVSNTYLTLNSVKEKYDLPN